jgi:glycosyltransferase involved in cell wall biosynthesis
MMNTLKDRLSYLITVSRDHFLPAQFAIINLRKKTQSEIVVVGNLNADESAKIVALGAKYINEDDIDLSGRMPKVEWNNKYQRIGWYKQQFIRLSIDRFMTTEQVVILDAEVFPFENWNEDNFYDPHTGNPRCFYWIPQTRKPDWDYKMYRGAAYLLSFLPECEGILDYANSNLYKRHISGVVLFSTKNVKELWRKLEAETDLARNADLLFNQELELSFSDHDIYGLAVEYGLFDRIVPTTMHNNLLGWYDNHDDPNFHIFKVNASWSMCQRYSQYLDADSYYAFMQDQAQKLGQQLPSIKYWNLPDLQLLTSRLNNDDISYFEKYKSQLDFTFRKRFLTMYKSLELINHSNNSDINIVEIGTLRDNNQGGGHSTYKFGEYCSRFGGAVHTVDILPEAIQYSMQASSDYQPWINYYTEDSEIFLDEFSEKIDLLYLDGYDSTPGEELQASQKQLNEIKTALPKLKDKCVVLLDDADLPEGGKAKFSSEFLIDNGFELVIDGYQQLYARGFDDETVKQKINPQTLATLEKLIADLPEVYQSVYVKGELIREGVRGNEFERLEVIKNYIKPNQTILDIGSNVGFFTINLAKLFPENIFVSIENQYPYARLQQELIELEGVNNVILINSTMSTEWLVEAAEACTYFDTTLLLSVLHHIPDAENFLHQLNKISKSLIMELPHPDESRVCGKDVIREQLTVEKIGEVKPVFEKIPYESTTHCDPTLKRSFYYADSPEYKRKSIYPYIGYPLAPRSYQLEITDRGLAIHKFHVDRDIEAIPGILLSDIAQIGRVMVPNYERCLDDIKLEFDRLDKLDNVADLRPWNILLTTNGLRFIDYEYTSDLDANLKLDRARDFNIVNDYFKRIFNIKTPPTILVDGVFFQLYSTGIARVWKSLLEEWAKTEFSDHIIVLDRAGTAPRIPGINYRKIPEYDYGDTDRDRAILQYVCDEECADLFISSYYTTPLHTPSVFMAYDMIPEVMDWNLSQPMWQEKQRAIQQASSFIAISEHTAKDLRQCCSEITPASVTVAHCGVSAKFVPTPPELVNLFKNKYGINKPYFILVGAASGYKNSPLFFQAFQQLATRNGFDIVCTGNGGELAPESRNCTVGSTVHMLRLSDEELAMAYSGAIALVYPSKYEGFGMPIAEAMACGCPVITCPNSSIPEVAGDAAIYVNDDDIDGMAVALCEVQKPQIRSTLITKGLIQAQQFSWTKMAEIVRSVLIDRTIESLQLQSQNLIILPDWSVEEETLGEELGEIFYQLAQQTNIEGMTILIDTSNASDLEEANLLFSSVAMNLMISTDLDITEHLVVSLMGQLSPIQREAVVTKLTAKISLDCENSDAIERWKGDRLPVYQLQRFA